MEQNELKPLQVKDIFIENSQKFLSYLINKNPKDYNSIQPEYIINSRLRTIYYAIKKLVELNCNIEIDILLDTCKTFGENIEYEEIKLLQDSFNDFSNIEYVKKRLKQDYLKQIGLKNLTKDAFVHLDRNGDLELNKLKSFVDEAKNIILEIESGENDLLSFEDIFLQYKTELLERWDGKQKRSIGIPEIDKYLTYAGEPGTMMSIAASTGCGKTTILLNSLINNINRDICCIYFSLDMSLKAICDRYICIKGRMTNSEVISGENVSRELKAKILKYAQEYTTLKNYIHYPEDKSLTLDKLDAYLYKAKQRFKSLGVLPEDEYMFIYIDTLDLVEDFSGMDPNKMEIGINKLHFILRKHKCFALNALQLNENKLRSSHMTPEKIDSLHYSIEDIFGSSAFSKRNRAVIVAQRNSFLKKRLFPTHAEREMWDLEADILKMSIVKQNDGPLTTSEFIFDAEKYRITPKLINSDTDTNN